MSFVAIEEIMRLTGFSRRTVDRKLKAFQATSPETYQQITKRQGLKIIYDPAITHILGAPMQIDISPDVPAPKPRKPPEPKAKGPKLTPTYELTETEKDFATFQDILRDFRTGSITLNAACLDHGVSWATLVTWIDTRSTYRDLYDDAYKVHKRAFSIYVREVSKQSLVKLVTGYEKQLENITYETKMTPTGQVLHIEKERKVVTKHILPSPNMIMFALTNKDPDDWKRLFTREPLDKDKEDDPFENMSNDQLVAFVDKARDGGLLADIQQAG